MSEENKAMSEREQIEMLLPWYVTRRLAAGERAKVEAWLERDPELARQLLLVSDETAEARRASESIPVPPGLSVEATLAKALEQERRRLSARRAVSQPGPIERLSAALRDFLTLPEGNLRLAAVAALAMIAVQGAAIATLVALRESTYQVAGGPAALAAGTFALVRFTDAAQTKAIAELLASRGMTIVDGPKPGGLFRVRIGAGGLAASERDARIAALRDEAALVSLVLPAN